MESTLLSCGLTRDLVLICVSLYARSQCRAGLQLWVNLKSTDKMCDPAYQELKTEQVPEATRNGVTAKIIAGEAFDVQSPVYTRTPTVRARARETAGIAVWLLVGRGR